MGLAMLALLAAAAIAVGQSFTPPGTAKQRLPVSATSGNKSELIQRVPIRRHPGRGERVAMRIAPAALDPLEAGDQLRTTAEVQVSTTCIVQERRCIGHSYTLSPFVTAQVVLSRSHRARSPHIALSRPVTVLCKQHRPNRNHHCTLTITNTVTSIPNPHALPCPPDHCFVNLLLSAHNRKAKPHNFVVLGGDRPDGTLEQDKGRLSLIQAHAGLAPPSITRNAGLLHRHLPLTISDADKRRVVYSAPIVAPRRGEVVAFNASFLSAINALPFNTFVSSRVILTTGPFKTHPHQRAKTAIRFRGQATESNGFDCTLGPSGYANPCITQKAGAIRFRRDVIQRRSGKPVTLWLTVLAAAKPLLAETKVTQAHTVSLAAMPDGLTIWRYGG
jgi:hypothetical protein